MTKEQLINELQKIEGNPEIFAKHSSSGVMKPIDEVELCLHEVSNRGTNYSYSIGRKEELGIKDECIVLWY